MMRVLMTTMLVVTSLTVADRNLCGQPGRSDQLAGGVLTDFDEPLLFTYLAWDKAVTVADGQARVTAKTNRGGGGSNFNEPLNLAAMAGRCPVLVATVHPGNKAKTVRVRLFSGEGNGAWTYRLEGRPVGKELRIEPNDPNDGATLKGPNEVEKAFDLTRVGQIQFQGDWGQEPIDVSLQRVVLAEPSAEAKTARAELLKRETAKAASLRMSRQQARQGIRHAESSPKVIHVGAVAPEILGITIVEGSNRRQEYSPYGPRPDDKIIDGGGKVAAWVDGKLIEQAPEMRTLHRMVDGQEREVGYIVGGREGTRFLWPFEERSGDSLQNLTAGETDSYRVVSRDDSNFAGVKTPAVVHRKTKPTDRVFPSQQQILRHTVYLVLSSPLAEGKKYTIEFPGINVNVPSVQYMHDTHKAQSEAIHVQQVGYRPDDPYKRAFLSIWLGSGGSYTHKAVPGFELIDASGRAVFRGEAELVLPADGKERMKIDKNYSQTAVHALDFSRFKTPGEFQVRVPGIGVSDPFTIGPKVWEEAFRKSMHGFLCQRSGIALGPPFTSFLRPRDMHPADGWKVFRSKTSADQAPASGDWFAPLIKGRTDELRPEAWGGYHDAGDFDRASTHLWATYLHLELYDLFPAYFARLKLALPPGEAKDTLPDVLNEALWNLDCFRRLQEADGGVGGGIESSAHPRAGEASFVESLVIMTYAPDVSSSYIYATVAARAARLLKPLDAKLSATYAASAVRAWNWAEPRRKEGNGAGYQALSVDDSRNCAAVELLWLMGEPKYDEAFQETTKVNDDGWVIEQQGGAFAYARLPVGLGDTVLKAQARRKLLAQADAALDYGDGNAFGLTVENKYMPLIGPVGAFTTPGMNSRILPRAHYLSGDRKYLAGSVRATNFPLGANPGNQTMTTGVGRHAPEAPLHFDSRFSGQEAPAGLTVYGAYDAESLPDFAKASDWIHTYYIGSTTIPDSRSWPPAEGYVDFFLWPMMNEFTISQNMGPTSYWWGYLAARPEK